MIRMTEHDSADHQGGELELPESWDYLRGGMVLF